MSSLSVSTASAIQTYGMTRKPILPVQHQEQNFMPAPDVAEKPRLLGLFLAGLGMGLGGAAATSFLRAQLPKLHIPVKTEQASDLSQRFVQQEHQWTFGISKGMLTLLTLAAEEPQLRKPLLGYLGATVVGAMAGSMGQGLQEVWVRQAETGLRAQLIERLQSVFAQSIRNKQQFDAQLRESTRQQLFTLLQAEAGIAPEKLKSWLHGLQPKVSAPGLLFDPVLCQPLPAQFGQREKSESLSEFPPSSLPGLFSGAYQLAAWAGGVLSGVLTHALGAFLLDKAPGTAPKTTMQTYINVNDTEAMWVFESLFKRRKTLIPLVALITGGGLLGKLALDGLREIEVTRKHSDIEYAYQKDNWLRLDPGFHRLAETLAVQDELAQLRQQLPSLKHDEALLKNRVQTLLSKIGAGYWSAPKYFSMTMPVSLVPARG